MVEEVLISLIKSAPMPYIIEFEHLNQIDFLISFDNYIYNLIHLYTISAINMHIEYHEYLVKSLKHLIVRLSVVIYHNKCLTTEEKESTFNILNIMMEELYQRWTSNFSNQTSLPVITIKL